MNLMMAICKGLGKVISVRKSIQVEDCYIQITVLIRLITIDVNATMAIPCFSNLQVIMESTDPSFLEEKKNSEKVKNVEISTFLTTNNYCTTSILLF